MSDHTQPGFIPSPLVWAIDARDDDHTRLVQVPESETVQDGPWRYVRDVATVATVCTAFGLLVSFLSI